jgi:hypothetical protein
VRLTFCLYIVKDSDLLHPFFFPLFLLRRLLILLLNDDRNSDDDDYTPESTTVMLTSLNRAKYVFAPFKSRDALEQEMERRGLGEEETVCTVFREWLDPFLDTFLFVPGAYSLPCFSCIAIV